MTICEGDGDSIKECPLLLTKPGQVSPELQKWASTAYRLARLKEYGATYAYPDALRPAEWAALDGIALGRIEDEGRDREAKQADAAEQAMIARLEAAKGRK